MASIRCKRGSHLDGKRRLGGRLPSSGGDVQLHGLMSRTQSIPAPTELRCTERKEATPHLAMDDASAVAAAKLRQLIRLGKLWICGSASVARLQRMARLYGLSRVAKGHDRGGVLNAAFNGRGGGGWGGGGLLSAALNGRGVGACGLREARPCRLADAAKVGFEEKLFR